jgi:8-oxo-dGTP pyrophosphatase MutT (NUDIX family)
VQRIKEQIEKLRNRLQEPLPGFTAHEKMASRLRPVTMEVPDNARPSSVLSLLFPKEDELHLLLIKRVADGKAHSGQISFPGGKQDPTDADLRVTALREANEEVGIMSEDVDILGALTPLYIPVSNFHVYPFVAFCNKQLEYNISKNEVAQVLEVPVKELLIPERKIVTDVVSPGINLTIKNAKAYRLDSGTIIWGATAMMIAELEEILHTL